MIILSADCIDIWRVERVNLDTMKNNKLKKLGNFFAKGAKVGLTAAMLATTACSNILTIDDLQNSGIVEENTYGMGSDFEINQEGMQKQLFGRHRFAPANATFDGLSHKEIGDFGWRLYTHAAKYLTEQLAEFNQCMQEEPNEKFRNLAQKMKDNNAFKYDIDSTVSQIIDDAIIKNLNDCADLIANMVYPLEPKTRHKFMACYDYLANRAYNDSLGKKAGTMPRANSDLAATKKELQDLGIKATDFGVESAMYVLLSEDVSKKTGVSLKTLCRGVNVALCSDGMWGARDLGGSAEVLKNSPTYLKPGTLETFLGEWSKDNFTDSVDGKLQYLFGYIQVQDMAK